MSIQQEETIGNNAAVRLFLAVLVAIAIFLLFGWFAWWSPRETVVVPQDRDATIVTPAPTTP